MYGIEAASRGSSKNFFQKKPASILVWKACTARCGMRPSYVERPEEAKPSWSRKNMMFECITYSSFCHSYAIYFRMLVNPRRPDGMNDVEW